MKRRNFLGSLIAVPLATKTLLSSEKSEITNEIEKTSEDVESAELTKDFFTYIKWNKTKFKWRQMQCPADVFDEYPVIAKSRKLKIVIHDVKYSEFDPVMKSFVIKSIVEEMEEEFVNNKLKCLYFHNLWITLGIYHREDISTARGIIIRYARRGK